MSSKKFQLIENCRINIPQNNYKQKMKIMITINNNNNNSLLRNQYRLDGPAEMDSVLWKFVI